MLPKLFFICILVCFIFSTHSYNTQCLHHQKILLLQLKDELSFDSSFSTKLVRWNESDECCNWHGVECDAAGRVVSLQLDNESIYGEIADSSSMFRLVNLQKLNLAYNKFNYTRIPKGIHNLTYLTHLNLSHAGFGGQVPAEISSLGRLVSLDISFDFTISVKLEMLVQNLTGLRELYLDYANISSHESRKWSHIISSYMPNITTLSLEHCGLSGPFARSFSRLHSLSILRLDNNPLSATVPDLFAKLSSLSTVSLAGCDLKGSFPSKIFHIPTLQNLQLSYNGDLNGNIPPFTQIGSLKSIFLSYTNFSGLIPSSVSNLKSLTEIDLSHCRFTGSIPPTLANLTKLNYVDLSHNFLTSSLSSKLFEGLPNLLYLDLRGNRLEGSIPDSFFQLESLESLFLSGNLFNGTFQLDKIQSLVNLRYLDLSGINLSLDVHSSTHGLPRLDYLHLASCNLYDFPDFIRHSNVSRLDLSNNRIAGEIPNWIWGRQLQHLNLSFNLLTHLQKPCHIPASLRFLDLHSNQLDVRVLDVLIPPNIGNRTSDMRELDLSNNRIAGEIPSWIWKEQLSYLSLANNSLSGSIPTSVCNAGSLNILDLSVNELNGSIPSCLFDDTMYLSVLDLGQNNISGSIPDNFPMDYCNLQYLDLNNNSLQGKIPKSLERCEGLQFMNVGNNNITDSFPCMLSLKLRVLVLRSNKFHGEVRCHEKSWPELQIVDISSNHFIGSLESINFSSWKAMVLDINDANFRYSSSFSNLEADGGYAAGVRLTMKGLEVELVKIWPDFTSIDLSCNNFGGEIPNAIGDLSALRLLNLSHNDISGSIPKSFGKLGELEALDLSNNQLTGLIPMELAGISFLSVLNLSYNKLVGEIPNGRQFQTFSADSFIGNTGLCGFNLNISCSDHLSPQEDENGEEKSEIEWEYVCAAVGYVVGLGIIVWLLLFSRSFKEKYFGKVEEVFEDICDARIRRKRRRRHARRVVRNQVRRQ